MTYEENIKTQFAVAFPLPSLLSSIKDLLLEVQWLDGLILVTDSQQATFVPFSQVDSLLRMVRARPNGQIVVNGCAWHSLMTMMVAEPSLCWCFRVMTGFGWE